MTPAAEDALDFWEQYWHGLYATPRAWAHTGENLVHAFEAVLAASEPGSMNFNLSDQALMLAGMAVEVQLKAILVHEPSIRGIVTRQIAATDEHQRKLLRAFYSHRLVELFFAASIELTEEQRDAAKALTQYIYWRGRYVVPTERLIVDLIPLRGVNGLTGPAHCVSMEAARELVSLVMSEVRKRLYGEV